MKKIYISLGANKNGPKSRKIGLYYGHVFPGVEMGGHDVPHAVGCQDAEIIKNVSLFATIPYPH